MQPRLCKTAILEKQYTRRCWRPCLFPNGLTRRVRFLRMLHKLAPSRCLRPPPQRNQPQIQFNFPIRFRGRHLAPPAFKTNLRLRGASDLSLSAISRSAVSITCGLIVTSRFPSSLRSARGFKQRTEAMRKASRARLSGHLDTCASRCLGFRQPVDPSPTVGALSSWLPTTR